MLDSLISIRTRKPMTADELPFVEPYTGKIEPGFRCNPPDLNRTIKGLVWAMTDGRCYYYGVPTNPFTTFSVDHKVPRAKGGRNCLMNLVPACRSCNSSKRDRMLHTEWVPAKPFYASNEWTLLYQRYMSIIDLCNCWVDDESAKGGA